MKILKTTLVLLCTVSFVSCGASPANEQTVSPAATDYATEIPAPAYVSMPALARSDFHYITLEDNEILPDVVDYALPEFVDIVSFKKNITDAGIVLYIGLRGLPSELTINQSSVRTNVTEYSWRVNFDTDCDETISFDISLVHQKFWERGGLEETVRLDDAAFETVAIHHQVTTGQQIAEGSIIVDGNTIILNFSKSENPELESITSDTPIHIFTEYNNGDIYVYDLIPHQ